MKLAESRAAGHLSARKSNAATGPVNGKLFTATGNAISKDGTGNIIPKDGAAQRRVYGKKHETACSVKKVREAANALLLKQRIGSRGAEIRKKHNETAHRCIVQPSSKKSAPSCMPEKLMLLNEFYEGLEAAISLLRIRRQICTFSSICGTIESLTKRRFLRSHLLKMKHIFPEVLHLENVVIQDPDTLCMKKDLRITLLPLPPALGLGSLGEGNESPNCNLSAQTVRRRKEFHIRLLRFVKSHPQEEDITEAPLPRDASEGRTPPPSMTEAGSKAITSSSSIKLVEPSDGEVHEEPKTAKESVSENEQLPSSTASPLWINPGRSQKNLDLEASVVSVTSHFPPPFKPFFSSKGHLSAVSFSVPSVNSIVGRTSQDKNCSRKLSMDSQPLLSAGNAEDISLVPLIDSSEACTKSRRQLFHHDNEDHLQHSPAAMKSYSSEVSSTTKVLASSTQISLSSSPSLSPISTSDFSSPQTQDRSGRNTSVAPSQFATPVASLPKAVVLSSEASPATTPYHSSPQATPLKLAAVSLHRHRIIKSLDFHSPSKAALPSTVPHRSDTDSASQSDLMASPISAISHISSLTTTPNNTPSSKRIILNKTPSSVRADETPSRNDCKTPFKTPTAPLKAANSEQPFTLKRSKLNLEPLFSGKDESFKVMTEDPLNVKNATISEIVDTTDDSFTASPQKKQRGLHSANRKGSTFESDLDIIKSLSPALLQSIKEKEKMIYEQEKGNVAHSRRRQQMLAGLPQLFNMLRVTFQSQNRSVMTHKELIRKILSSYNDITDQTEVYDRMQLMLELAPEWISAKPSLNGETLYRIQKTADVAAIRKRLAAAH
ncbi:hypothetical protein O6H91_02G124900 [Diphasiastrum complanatum]|uniref:Uncharacterized protein n=1 Tax=Diphasiastrum complanatum TaxID=34168 RepID=A0ACC2EKC5_DIPCM|nr:hypothetical protein O6H91_02G124900 [Diphasiastrum complanatum]